MAFLAWKSGKNHRRVLSFPFPNGCSFCYVCLFALLCPSPQHAEVPRPGMEPSSQQQPEPQQWQRWSFIIENSSLWMKAFLPGVMPDPPLLAIGSHMCVTESDAPKVASFVEEKSPERNGSVRRTFSFERIGHPRVQELKWGSFSSVTLSRVSLF